MRAIHDHIITTAAESFREELLGSMRNAMLKAAQEEIEHILHEYSKQLSVQTNYYDDPREMCRVMNIQIKDRNYAR